MERGWSSGGLPEEMPRGADRTCVLPGVTHGGHEIEAIRDVESSRHCHGRHYPLISLVTLK
jgi:hypothetical protein